MRVYIEQIETGLFYGWRGEWTRAAEATRTFPTVAAAQQFCRWKRLSGVQVLEDNGRGKVMAYPSLSENGESDTSKP